MAEEYVPVTDDSHSFPILWEVNSMQAIPSPCLCEEDREREKGILEALLLWRDRWIKASIVTDIHNIILVGAKIKPDILAVICRVYGQHRNVINKDSHLVSLSGQAEIDWRWKM